MRQLFKRAAWKHHKAVLQNGGSDIICGQADEQYFPLSVSVIFNRCLIADKNK